MEYTPFCHHTDDELVNEVHNKPDASDLEIELAERVVRLQDEVDALKDDLGR